MCVRTEIGLVFFTGQKRQKILKITGLLESAAPLFKHLIQSVEQELKIDDVSDHIDIFGRTMGAGTGQKDILFFNSGIGVEKMPVGKEKGLNAGFVFLHKDSVCKDASLSASLMPRCVGLCKGKIRLKSAWNTDRVPLQSGVIRKHF